jgi:hypothetical protein
MPVRVKKTRQKKNPEYLKTDNAPAVPSLARSPSTAARRRGNLRPAVGQGNRMMTKPVKTEAELIAMAKAELKVHADCPDGLVISVLRSGDSWEFRAGADAATAAKPGYPECVAMLVQIGDHLGRQYDVKG